MRGFAWEDSSFCLLRSSAVLLAHPLTASLQVDDPATTELRKQIIVAKPFLKAVYDEWYGLLARALPQGEGQVLELGSGCGYCGSFIPGLPNVRRFFAEASRCLRSQGKVLMIEPWVTSWSRLVFTHLHSEPFLPDAPDWSFSSSGHLSGANIAILGSYL